MHSNKGYENHCDNEISSLSRDIASCSNMDSINVSTCEPADASTPAKTESNCHKQRLINIGLFLADQVFSGLVVGPLTVFYWWGAWNLLSRHIYPNDPNINAIICMVVGNCGLVFLALSQEMWKRLLPVNDNWLVWLVGFHGYVLVCGLFNVCHWRGVWIIMDHYTGTGVLNFCITYIIGQGSLMFLKSSKSAQAPPTIIVSDRTSTLFSYSVRFRTEPTLTLNFIYDAMFTVIIINQFVVFYWRGAWGLLDELFLKDQTGLSTWIGFAVAYSLMFILCFLQPAFNLTYNKIVQRRIMTKAKKSTDIKHYVMNIFKLKHSYNCRSERGVAGRSSTPQDDTSNTNMTLDEAAKYDNKCEALLRWFLDVIIYFISNIVNVFIWRSVWRFCDEYLLPWNKDAGNVAGICIGFGILMILTCSPSITIRGCDIDGDETIPSELKFYSPNLYFRSFYTEFTKIPFYIS